MNIRKEESNIVLENYNSFDIDQTLLCGQCFRFYKLDEKEYIIVAHEKELHIKQNQKNIVFMNTTLEDFENIWYNYFDLAQDYDDIKNRLAKDDEILKKAINFAEGIRILNQDPFECLISFIISQNNRIPMIKKVIENISQKYGSKINNYYTFPKIEILKNATEDELKDCKTGFRAKYIIDAVDKIYNNQVIIDNSFDTDELRNNLMKIKGVGIKVADCFMLFSQKRFDVFPTDVWIKRVMEYFYFENKDTPIKEIHILAKQKFGRYSGFAQQYLFNYARELQIGK